jgi:hypothetical protein
MVTRPIAANAGMISQVKSVVIQGSEAKPKSWLQRLELILRRAFGEDEEIIASSLRGL